MNTQNPSFLSENRNRQYPLSEDSSWPLSSSSILDLRGWSRLPILANPRVHTVSRWDDSGSTAPAVQSDLAAYLVAGNIQIFLELFDYSSLANRIISINIPVDNSTWPYLAKGQLIDGSGVLVAQINATVDSAITGDLPGNADIFSAISCPIEPALIVPIGGQVIDQLKVIHQDGTPDEYIRGKVVIKQGINSRITQRNSTIEFLAEKYAGLGNNKYEGDDRGKCRGVLHINSSSPNDKGFFFIKGENGVVVTDYPEEHRINIGIVPDSKLIGCSDGD